MQVLEVYGDFINLAAKANQLLFLFLKSLGECELLIHGTISCHIFKCAHMTLRKRSKAVE